MRTLLQDLRYGARMLVRNPGFTAAAVLSLALGIGANTTIFSVVNGVLLRPLPVEKPERLVTIYTGFRRGSPYSVTSYPDYVDIRDRGNVFSGVAAHFYFTVSVKGNDRPEVLPASVVSSNYFDVLGVEALLGRTFAPEEDDDPVMVLSHGLWRRAFGSAPDILGKTVLINSYPFTVIGVAPKGFTSTTTGLVPDVWIPVLMGPRALPVRFDIHDRDQRWLRMVGRLKPGVSVAQAQAAVTSLAAGLRREYPDSHEGVRFTVVAAEEGRLPGPPGTGIAVVMGLLMGVVGLVLLIACSNVANLLLARAVGREKEIAMRLALGGGRRRIIRQLLTESVLLSLLAGTAGVLFAVWAIELIGVVDPPTLLPIQMEIGLDWRALGFTLLVSMLTGLILGLVPALRASSLNLCAALKDSRPGTDGGVRSSRLQNCLVTSQVALSLVLLIVAGLCLKNLYNVLVVDPGFDVRNTLVADFNLTHGQYDEAKGKVFFRELVERVERLPGVQSASLAYLAPLPVGTDTFGVSVDGYDPGENERMIFDGNIVGAGYFETLGIPIVRGRGFDERDRQDTQPVMVINETMARRFWPGDDPIGRRVETRGRQHLVVGVAKDVKYRSLTEQPTPYLYLALSQRHVSLASLHVRASSDPRTLTTPVLHEFQRLDPNLPVEIKTMSEQMEFAMFGPFMAAAIVGAFALLALALATVGAYGVMSYSVSQRTHEFGIRTALGAGRDEIVALVLHQGLKISLIGVVLGLAGSFSVTRVLSGFLYRVSPLDPVVFVGVSAALTAVALLACYIPARRAAKVDPMAALRYE